MKHNQEKCLFFFCVATETSDKVGKALNVFHVLYIITWEMCDQQHSSATTVSTQSASVSVQGQAIPALLFFLGARLSFVYFDISMEKRKNETD